jgi:hypothetical protein
MATTEEQTLINVFYARKVGEGAYCFSPVRLFVRPHKCIISIFIFLNFSQNYGLLKLVIFFVNTYMYTYIFAALLHLVFKLDFFSQGTCTYPRYTKGVHIIRLFISRVMCC